MSFENRPFAKGLTKVADEARARLIARIGEPGYTVLYDRVSDRAQESVFETLLASSEFFVEMAARHCDWLAGALHDGCLLCATPDEPADWDRMLESMVGVSATEVEVTRVLRIFRNQQLLRILWQDAAGISTIEAVFAQLSQLADCCIRFAVRCAQSALSPKFGEPVGGESNDVQSLVVLAMGKLGGQELNFSSDIDLPIRNRGRRGADSSASIIKPTSPGLGRRLFDCWMPLPRMGLYFASTCDFVPTGTVVRWSALSTPLSFTIKSRGGSGSVTP
jgi:glutamine synthetase adenylyltransferase